jgi:DNA alkylation repair enzyme
MLVGMPTASPSPRTAARKPAKTPLPRLSLAEVMDELEKAGSEQTRKLYARHAGNQPMFGVSFATLKLMMKRIRVDHELACALWETGNLDARNLAVKIVDPAAMTSADLDQWARDDATSRASGGYVSGIAAEGPHANEKAGTWIGSADPGLRSAGWRLLSQLAMRDEALPDSFFAAHLATIERTIHTAPNDERSTMNGAVIAIGGHNTNLREAALAAAARIGRVDVDHGDTACETPDAAGHIAKAWARATEKGFESPAAQERKREQPRLRC